jgi:chromosome segregation protein
LQGLRSRLESAQARSAAIDAELATLAGAFDDAQAQARDSRARLSEAVGRMSGHEDERLQLDQLRRSLGEGREGARNSAREARENAHKLALTLESQRASVLALTQSLARMGSQRAQLEMRLNELKAQLAEGDAPVERLQAERQTVLDQRVLVEKGTGRRALGDGRRRERAAQVRADPPAARPAGAGAARGDRRAPPRRAGPGPEVRAIVRSDRRGRTGAGHRAGVAAGRSRLRGLVEGDRRHGREAAPAGAGQPRRHLRIRRAEGTQDLPGCPGRGLVRSPEHPRVRDQQDRQETRGRFKETFDRVNAGVQELYPRLFGGGHAYLELTGEDLLDTGVSIMARPPGKRVSNISLLSGGEKALTAVALVFAIFRLNPAPFCLLDEVDAPLDEANVGRFSTMVTEMSEKVQFLFVTHNKATMEAAEQLSGVTMREPGVSRLVSVDLAEASRLVGAA